MSQFTIFCALSCHNFIWVSLKEDSAAPRVAGAIKIVSLRETELQKNLDDACIAKKGGKEKFMSIPNFDYEDGASIISLQGNIWTKQTFYRNYSHSHFPWVFESKKN